jgi:hypothetical protein
MPEKSYRVKSKPKKGQPLSAAQKKAVEQGTFQRKVETPMSKVKTNLWSGYGATSKEPKDKLIKGQPKNQYKGTKTTGKTVKARGAGGIGFCPTGTKNCKTAYGKYSR